MASQLVERFLALGRRSLKRHGRQGAEELLLGLLHLLHGQHALSRWLLGLAAQALVERMRLLWEALSCHILVGGLHRWLLQRVSGARREHRMRRSQFLRLEVIVQALTGVLKS